MPNETTGPPTQDNTADKLKDMTLGEDVSVYTAATSRTSRDMATTFIFFHIVTTASIEGIFFQTTNLRHLVYLGILSEPVVCDLENYFAQLPFYSH